MVGGMTRAVGLILPGLPQLLKGRWLGGGTALSLWVLLVGLTLARFPRVVGAFSAGVEGWIAFLTLISVLGGVWVWSFRRRGGEGPLGSGVRGGFWEGFAENRMAVVGLWVIGASYLVALLTPILAPFDPAYQPAYQAGQMELILAPPSFTHILGTDQFSRDIFSRILYGARISLSIGLLAVGISVSLGAVLGAVAGYLGGWVDMVVMRFVDMVMAFPRLVLLIGLVAFFPRSILLIILALAFTQWPFTTRIVRGEVLGLREREFTEAARALGFSRARIIFRHLLPNALAPIIVAATLGIGNTIILEAGLSFLGLGVEAPTPSWGIMVATGRALLLDAWWVATFPGLAIVAVVLAFNLAGDGLRDAFDPRRSWGMKR
jgi:peptide/nickel transport system permease protein